MKAKRFLWRHSQAAALQVWKWLGKVYLEVVLKISFWPNIVVANGQNIITNMSWTTLLYNKNSRIRTRALRALTDVEGSVKAQWGLTGHSTIFFSLGIVWDIVPYIKAHMQIQFWNFVFMKFRSQYVWLVQAIRHANSSGTKLLQRRKRNSFVIN